jgi:hypothetical protein
MLCLLNNNNLMNLNKILLCKKIINHNFKRKKVYNIHNYQKGLLK